MQRAQGQKGIDQRRRGSRRALAGILVAAVAALVSLGPAVASAQIDARRKALPLTVVSDVLDSSMVQALTTIMIDRIGQYPDLEVMPVPKEEMLELLLEMDCVEPDAPCLSRVGQREGGDVVFFVTVTNKDTQFVLQYLLIDALSAAVIKGGERTAPDTRGLPDEMERAVREAFGPLPPPPPTEVEVRVETNVGGASVFLDDAEIGSTPLKTHRLPGQYVLRLEKAGYQDYREVIFVERDRPFTRVVTMRPVAIAAPPPVVAPTSAPTIAEPAEPVDDEDDGGAFYTTWWFWTAAAVVVAGGVTAAILASDSGSSSAATGGLLLTLDPAQVENDAVFLPR